MKEEFNGSARLNGTSPVAVRVLPREEYAVSYWSGGVTG